MSCYLGKVISSVVFTTFFTCCFSSNAFAKAIQIESAVVLEESIQISGVTSIGPEISNLALTVGMAFAKATFSVN
nr:hypothetical protein [uncultured Desulfobacter sp.]